MTYAQQIELNQLISKSVLRNQKRAPLKQSTVDNQVCVEAEDSFCKVYVTAELQYSDKPLDVVVEGLIQQSYTSNMAYYERLIQEGLLKKAIKDRLIFDNIVPKNQGIVFKVRVYNARSEGNINRIIWRAISRTVATVELKGFHLNQILEVQMVPQFYFYAYIRDKFIENPSRRLSSIRKGHVSCYYYPKTKEFLKVEVSLDQGLQIPEVSEILKKVGN